MNFKYITVLDYEDGIVYEYKLQQLLKEYSLDEDKFQAEDIEDILYKRGHSKWHIEWMCNKEFIACD